MKTAFTEGEINMAWYNNLKFWSGQEMETKNPSDGSIWSVGSPLTSVSEYNSTQEYINAYGNVGWVYACVSRISSAIADADWHLYEKGKEDEKIIDHPVLDLLHFVNPYHTGMEMMEQTQTYIDLVGEAFWMIIKDRAGRPSEMWVINPNKIKVVPHDTEYIAGYVYQNGQDQIPLETENIIHIKLPNPKNPYRGVSPVASIMSDVEAERFSSSYNRSFFQNSASPNGVISFDGTLTDAQYERLRYEWNNQHRGVNNAHKVAILEGGASWQGNQVSQRDMQFMGLRQMNRDVILGAFGMPLSILGISETVNRANAESSEFTFSRWVVRPRLQRIRAKLNEQFVPMFGNEKLVLTFTDPVPQNVERNLSVADTGFKSGYVTRNEAREKLGLPAVEGGDIFLTPLSSYPESADDENDDDITENPNDPTTPTEPTAPEVPEPNENEDTEGDEVETDDEKMTSEYKVKATEFEVGRWKSFEKGLTKLERESEVVVADYLKNLEEQILSLDFYDIKFEEKLSRLRIDNREKTQKMIQDIYISGMEKGGKETQDNIMRRVRQRSYKPLTKQDPSIDDFAMQYSFDFDLDDDRIKTIVQNRSDAVQKLMDQTTYVKVASKVNQGIINGDSIEQVASKIQATGLFDKKRAMLIARTETVSSLNAGHIEASRQSGVVKGKRWLTAVDGLERESHGRADGQERKLDELFDLDMERVQAPAMGSEPSENLNCRCTMIEILDIERISRNFAKPDSNKKFVYPINEARCTKCKKLLAKKVSGIAYIWCQRCKHELKFDSDLGTTDIV
jgi:HK97 family phage portal protein